MRAHFGRFVGTLTRNIEQCDWSKGSSAGFESAAVIFPTRAESGHDARTCDDNALRFDGRLWQWE